MGKLRINRCQELETEFRSGTWAKRIYLERLLSSYRAPLTLLLLGLPHRPDYVPIPIYVCVCYMDRYGSLEFYPGHAEPANRTGWTRPRGCPGQAWPIIEHIRDKNRWGNDRLFFFFPFFRSIALVRPSLWLCLSSSCVTPPRSVCLMHARRAAVSSPVRGWTRYGERERRWI